MKSKRILIVVFTVCFIATVVSSILCVSLWNQDFFVKFKYSFIEKTDLFYPSPKKIENNNDIYELTQAALPDSAILIDYKVIKCKDASAELIEIAPYDYYFLVEFANDKELENYINNYIGGWEKVHTEDQYIDIVESFGYEIDDITGTYTAWRLTPFTGGRTLTGSLIHIFQQHRRVLICS